VHIRVHPDGKCGILDHGGDEILRLENCNGVLDENRKPVNKKIIFINFYILLF